MCVFMKHYSAIIGFGYMGPMHHDIIRKNLTEIEVFGVYDIRKECMDKAAERGLKTYESLDALLADPVTDLVTIATPNDSHKDLSIRCLRAGKNVVCEKPVTLCPADLEEIMAVAHETGKIFTIHHNRRWDKDYQQIKKIVHDNILGKPYYIESRVATSARGMFGWRGYKINGGGLLLDWGIHLLDQLLDLFDCPVVSVDAHVLSLYTPEADDNCRALIRYENGVSVLFEVAWNNFIPCPRWRMNCEHGTVVIDATDGPGVMKLADTTDEVRNLPSIVYTDEGPETREMTLPMNTAVDIPMPEVHGEWHDFYRNVAAAIEGTEQLIVRPEQALRVLKVIDLIHQSQSLQTAVPCRI